MTVLPSNAISPDLDLGTLLDLEDDGDRGRRDLAHLGRDFGVLAAALAEQLFEHDDRALHGGRVVAALDAEADACVP